ncbi:MAG: hypothetical protein Q7U09_13885 [Hydrogenophaga sp.]|jgi:hypothetical protein|nr:hypothetical protein [Hydrogenophaga sp.]MDO9292670.1 hypothetical protein [Hydrogenophaga sp.]MDZ4294445.1 hypothetical protein [Hydrogenophaga sp.]
MYGMHRAAWVMPGPRSGHPLDEHNDFLLKQRPVPQVQGNNRREK